MILGWLKPRECKYCGGPLKKGDKTALVKFVYFCEEENRTKMGEWEICDICADDFERNTSNAKKDDAI